MKAPFPEEWTPPGASSACCSEIQLLHARLEEAFIELQASEKRLAQVPGLGLPGLAMPFELAMQCTLRSLELSRGLGAILHLNNQVATFPVLRALYENWLVMFYADIQFNKLVVNGGRWAKFGDIAFRLIAGQSPSVSDMSPKRLEIGKLQSFVFDTLRALDGSDNRSSQLQDDYDMMSDGTHPSKASIAFHLEPRPDGRGTQVTRFPNRAGLEELLEAFRNTLTNVVEAVGRLRATGLRVEDAFRRGPAQDPALRERSREALIALRANPPLMAPQLRQAYLDGLDSMLETFQM